MSDKRLKFGDKEISKGEFYDNKHTFEIDNIDVNKIMVKKKKVIRKKMNYIDIILGMMIIMLLDLYL